MSTFVLPWEGPVMDRFFHPEPFTQNFPEMVVTLGEDEQEPEPPKPWSIGWVTVDGKHRGQLTLTSIDLQAEDSEQCAQDLAGWLNAHHPSRYHYPTQSPCLSVIQRP